MRSRFFCAADAASGNPYDSGEQTITVQASLVQALLPGPVLDEFVFQPEVEHFHTDAFGCKQLIDATSGAAGNGIFFNRDEIVVTAGH